ncbi:polyamine aminopropyltransferase [Denitratisoma sp. agr-D3]
MSERHPLFELPNPFEEIGGRVSLLEPPWAKVSELRARLLDESYAKPFVSEDGERRYLHFSLHLIQSAMRLAEPNALDLRYTQKMMSFLLFNPRPRRIVLIGLGGGSLVKFCHHRLPATQMTAVELSADVIALRDAFLLPPDGPQLEVLHADGSVYLAQTEKGIDALLVDAFDRIGFAPSLANREFFEQAYAKLAGNGVLVINLAGEKETYAGLIGEAMAVFDDRVIVVPVREDDNHLLLAFKDPGFDPNWRRLQAQAKVLRGKYGLDFPDFVDKLERSARMELARREAERGG